MTNNLIKLLRDGAGICRDRNINLDYAKVATQAADEIERLREILARALAEMRTQRRIDRAEFPSESETEIALELRVDVEGHPV